MEVKCRARRVLVAGAVSFPSFFGAAQNSACGHVQEGRERNALPGARPTQVGLYLIPIEEKGVGHENEAIA